MSGEFSDSEGLEFAESHTRNEWFVLEILKERERQLEKWGEQCHSIDRWLVILAEEVGEVAKAIFIMKPHAPAETMKELVQVAAVALAILTALDGGPRNND